MYDGNLNNHGKKYNENERESVSFFLVTLVAFKLRLIKSSSFKIKLA